MTTIHNLPEEILSMIFNKLGESWQKNCQHVCRSWYFTAHTILRNKVELKDPAAIKLFNDSFDYNPDPAYLTVVKSIKLGFGISDVFHLDDEVPTYLENFNDDMCKDFSKNCPKLETFTMINDVYPQLEYCDLVFKAKLLMTEIDMVKVEDVQVVEYGDVVQFLSSFPRLQSIDGAMNTSLKTFKQLLAILPYTLQLTSVYLGSGYDNENSVEKQLRATPKDEQDKLINHLSEIEHLSLCYWTNFCVNSLKFALKYFTGMEVLTLCSNSNRNWTEALTNLFNCLMSDVHKLKNFTLQLDNVAPDILSKCFPTVVRKMLPLTTKCTKTRILQMDITNSVSLFAGPLDSSSIHVYLCLDSCEIGLPLLEDLTIKATVEAKFQTLLDSYAFALPSLKNLTLCYYWKLGKEHGRISSKTTKIHFKITTT